MSQNKVSLIYGDGIGPEVVEATRKIIDSTKVSIDWQVCEAGAKIFKQGIASGIPKETLQSIDDTRLVLKGPLETPVGFGEKSANVTLRKLFETYANVRPVKTFPGIKTPYSDRNIDFVIVRENVEDLYAGIEYMQTSGVAESLKIITHKGCEKIVRFAFELALAERRKKIHCATKANIMKFSEGMLKKVFEDIAKDYPSIEAQHIIVDNCAHQMVRTPENFDVIVTTNMNGDILSDLGSGLIGGLGVAPGANIGSDIAIFEAVHGSAPKYAGKNIINPLAVLLSGVMMLRYIREFEAANTIEQAMVYTLESGMYTQDICKDKNALSTTDFTDKIIENFGRSSQAWFQREYQPMQLLMSNQEKNVTPMQSVKILGVDIFIQTNLDPPDLAQDLQSIIQNLPVILKSISSRGVQVYPKLGNILPDMVDHFACRFMMNNDDKEMTEAIIEQIIAKVGLKYFWMHIEKLCSFDGQLGFSKAQGED